MLNIWLIYGHNTNMNIYISSSWGLKHMGTNTIMFIYYLLFMTLTTIVNGVSKHTYDSGDSTYSGFV